MVGRSESRHQLDATSTRRLRSALEKPREQERQLDVLGGGEHRIRL